jgi:hypothetical protein
MRKIALSLAANRLSQRLAAGGELGRRLMSKAAFRAAATAPNDDIAQAPVAPAMTPLQAAAAVFYDKSNIANPAPRLFAVVTWGAAASRWLAGVLNDCPSVYCVHAHNTLWKVFAGADSVSGLQYMQIVGIEACAAALAGDVHGVSRFDIPAIQNFFGEKFRAAVLVRDPLPRLISQLALFEQQRMQRYADVHLIDTKYIDELFPDIVEGLPTGSDEERAFVHAANMLNAIIDEAELAPVFRMEDLVGDPNRLCELVKHLSAGEIVPPPEWAAAATQRAPVNRHRAHDAQSLEGWQLEILRDVVRTEARAAYERLGYDMDWLPLRT